LIIRNLHCKAKKIKRAEKNLFNLFKGTSIILIYNL
jgi:hypothetical protein